MVSTAEFFLWLSLAGIFYVYAGYPLLVLLVGRLRNREVQKRETVARVSLIVAAYNEEEHIAERLENVLASRYPKDALEIIIASDGSHDATNSIAASYASSQVKLLILPRRGKIHALNQAVAEASGEILIFSDANTFFADDALAKLVRNFADPKVGAVAGNKIYKDPPAGESSTGGEKLYWSYDKWLKAIETLCGSAVSADGAIYAIRGFLYQPLGDAAVTDDFAISTAAIEQGFRLVYEAEAVAYERVVPAAHTEFSRKVRLMTRGLRSLILRRRLLNPFKHGFYSVQLLSHKVLRRLVPVLLIVLFVSNIVAAAANPFYVAPAASQVLFYGLALSGFFLRRTRLGKLKFLVIPFFYCLANLAALLAILKVLAGIRIESWQPQRHAAEGSECQP